ncbi:MAG TPA: SH3 domain-containing protein [Pyrinomonadaceae bacterium]|nr:SH3 domain-containing protein [Pyrinomonadaceae bacterium]
MNITHLPSLRNLFCAGFAGALLLAFFPSTASAQVVLTIDRRVKVHETAALGGKRIDGLAPGSTVTQLRARRGSFFKVRLGNGKTGWVHGRYLFLPDIQEKPFGAETITAAATTAAAFPMCGPARHYRWSAKITTSGFTQTPTKPSVSAALNWTPLPFAGHDLLSWCEARSGREMKPFSVQGWVRRTRTEANDGDVHVEITQKANDPVTDCLVVEIPPADLSARFNKARNDLAALLSVSQLADTDFTTPIRVRFTGLAFWDGWHATSTLPAGHGRCNSTKGAAWELHPVFKVSAQ